MTMEKEQVLVLENITKAYGTRFSKEKKRVLGPVSLCVRKGEAVGITGENGAGKSTLLSVAAGVERQDAGKIELAPLGRGQLGYVPQEIALYPALTGIQNLRFFASAAGLYGRRRTIRCRYLLEKVNLADKADKPVSTYSGGMQRRLNLACALVGDVKLLLLDEHTAALDPATAAKVLELSDRIVRENQLTAMMITHNMKDAIVHGNRGAARFAPCGGYCTCLRQGSETERRGC